MYRRSMGPVIHIRSNMLSEGEGDSRRPDTREKDFVNFLVSCAEPENPPGFIRLN